MDHITVFTQQTAVCALSKQSPMLVHRLNYESHFRGELWHTTRGVIEKKKATLNFFSILFL